MLIFLLELLLFYLEILFFNKLFYSNCYFSRMKNLWPTTFLGAFWTQIEQTSHCETVKSGWSVELTDFKNVIFENIPPALSL